MPPRRVLARPARGETPPDEAWPHVLALDAERVDSGFFCPLQEPLLLVRRHTPSALHDCADAANKWPPGESAGGGTQRGPPAARCAQYGNHSCVPRSTKQTPTLAALCVRSVAEREDSLGAHLLRVRTHGCAQDGS
jgi:hypothetical protein